MRGQLSLKIQELRKEMQDKLCKSLTSTAHHVHSNAASTCSMLCQQSSTSSIGNSAPESTGSSDVPDETMKRLNALPKFITDFFHQMKNGCEDFLNLPKYLMI